MSLNKVYPRVKMNGTNVSIRVPTKAPTENHLDGQWSVTDIYNREFYINTYNKIVYYRADNDIMALSNSGHTHTDNEISLSNTSYTGNLSGMTTQDEVNNFIDSFEGGGTFTDTTITGSGAELDPLSVEYTRMPISTYNNATFVLDKNYVIGDQDDLYSGDIEWDSSQVSQFKQGAEVLFYYTTGFTIVEIDGWTEVDIPQNGHQGSDGICKIKFGGEPGDTSLMAPITIDWYSLSYDDFRADWEETDSNSPSFINNKPTLLGIHDNDYHSENYKVSPNKVDIVTSGTPTPTGDFQENELNITALSSIATIAEPTGTPAEGNTLSIKIIDDGTARTLNFNSIYRFLHPKPTTTVPNKFLLLGCIYDASVEKWLVTAVVEEV